METYKMKSFKIGYGDLQIVFHPRMASAGEESEFANRLSDVGDADENKYEKQFEICKEALAEFSAEMPQRIVKEKGETKYVPLVEGAETPHDAIQKFFSDRTPELERLARDSYAVIKSQFSPSVSFL